jgi:hypothetical protein
LERVQNSHLRLHDTLTPIRRPPPPPIPNSDNPMMRSALSGFPRTVLAAGNLNDNEILRLLGEYELPTTGTTTTRRQMLHAFIGLQVEPTRH